VLARALQDFGAYCDDSVGTEGLVLTAEGAAEDRPELTLMRRDFPILRQQMRLVTNNSPGTPAGGGGSRTGQAPDL
jgi:hypothetical protein